jgi:hypothetical protein
MILPHLLGMSKVCSLEGKAGEGMQDISSKYVLSVEGIRCL